MKYKYPKKKKILNLIIGVLWIAFGVYRMTGEIERYSQYVWIVFGIFYLGLALYMQIASYVTVTSVEIIKNNLIPIRIPFSEIVNVKEFGNEVTIFGKDKKLKIHKRNIQKEQIPQFEAFLETIEFE